AAQVHISAEVFGGTNGINSLLLGCLWCKLSCTCGGCLSLLAVLVKNHFVPIFAISMALHCSKESGWEKAAIVLQGSILRLAEISRSERDQLIKKHMCYANRSKAAAKSCTF
ncbi:hypothetical protein SO802_018537, partial [Lithocarpus litseifolius]